MQLQDITAEDLAKWWKEYVRQLAVLLVSEDKEGKLSHGVLDRIATLTSEQLALMRHVWVSSHDAYELFQVNTAPKLQGLQRADMMSSWGWQQAH